MHVVAAVGAAFAAVAVLALLELRATYSRNDCVYVRGRRRERATARAVP
jgi:hypothetical protein